MSNNEEIKIIRTEEEQQRSVEIFDSYRDELFKRQLSNSEAYDKAILSLSSAGLALSLTFIKFIVPLTKANYLSILKLSWLLFLASVITTVISFLISNKGISTQLKFAEEYYIEAKANALNKFNIYACFNTIFNYVSGVLFIFALICVVSFVTLNINHGEIDMSNKKESFATDGAAIPKMQQASGSGKIDKSAGIPPMGQAPGTVLQVGNTGGAQGSGGGTQGNSGGTQGNSGGESGK